MNKIYRIEHSARLKGDVASTGNSPLASVLESLKVFGGKGYFSPMTEHWQAIERKYYNERDRLHWEETGRHLPYPTSRIWGTKTKQQRKPRAQGVPKATLLAMVKIT